MAAKDGAHLIFVMTEIGECALISWCSKRLKRVARSTLAAECLALADGLDNALHIRHLYCELIFGNCESPNAPVIECIIDNKALYQTLMATKSNVTEKSLRIEISAIKEIIRDKKVFIFWKPAEKQLSNCLTKIGANPYPLINVVTSGNLSL